jgi:hypothetical protein
MPVDGPNRAVGASGVRDVHTKVVEWLTAQRRRFCWYSLDRYDNDVGLFGEHLATAAARLIGRDSSLASIPGGPDSPGR